MENSRDSQSSWIVEILRVRQWTPTELARRAGISQPTLTRFLNDPLNKSTLHARTIEKIARATGVASYAAPSAEAGALATPGGGDISELATDNIFPTDIDAALRALIAGRANIFSTRMRTRALESAGVMPNDILVIDMNEPPKRGDTVCAQVYSWPNMRAETVMRVYEPPYLVAATFDKELLRPYYVDDEKVIVKGTVIGLIRPRLAAA
ncbi:MAG TPA: helix-turn-helix transcriptional regulator [Xanthobacteraceae bacterium]